jgi:hypothetical protein
MQSIVLSINYVNYRDVKKKHYQDLSIASLTRNKPSNVKLISVNFQNDVVDLDTNFEVVRKLTRNSRKTIENRRELPYIKDILNISSTFDCNIFGYLNSDILVTKDFFDVFKNDIYAYAFTRIDIGDINDTMSLNNKKLFNIINPSHSGFDGFFFNKKWWLENNNKFSDDLVMGEPFWDVYYNNKIRSLTKKYKIFHSIYHVFHPTIWNLKSNGAINNKKIFEQV